MTLDHHELLHRLSRFVLIIGTIIVLTMANNFDPPYMFGGAVLIGLSALLDTQELGSKQCCLRGMMDRRIFQNVSFFVAAILQGLGSWYYMTLDDELGRVLFWVAAIFWITSVLFSINRCNNCQEKESWKGVHVLYVTSCLFYAVSAPSFCITATEVLGYACSLVATLMLLVMGWSEVIITSTREDENPSGNEGATAVSSCSASDIDMDERNEV